VLRRDAWERWVGEQDRRAGFELGAGPFCVRAARLKGLAGTLSWSTQPEHVFAHELAGRIRVIAGLDQPPILLHSEKWPDHRGALAELRQVRSRLRCGPEDALVVVWGPNEDTLTAVEEVRLRYVDATQGVPNETRQPFADGSTDFERILPGPDRMYPDTDSPPSRVTRERVERLSAGLPERPWDREARYTAAGVPRLTTHFLIRRGGARLVDKVVAEAGADLRRACFFFGERLKGLRRNGVPVQQVPEERWAEFFRLVAERPVLWENWQRIVRRLAAAPETPVAEIVAAEGLGAAPPGWRETVPAQWRNAAAEAHDDNRERVARLCLGRLLHGLRGKVAVADLAPAVEHAMMTTGDAR
jgi:Glu-tRNA(Gln) amidotransferase subunit E-like FAD-binding protein